MFAKRFSGRLSQLFTVIKSCPDLFYLVVATPAVIAFAVFTPPFHGPDEDAHFTRAYQIASGNVFPDSTNEGIGGRLPVQVSETINESSYSPNIRGYSSSKYDPALALREMNDAVTEPSKTKFYDTGATSTYTPLAYLPAVLAIAPVSAVNGPPILGLYLARIFTGILTVGLFYVAIRIFPGRKMMLAIPLLLPMLLFQQAVVSIDGISYALLAVFLVYIVRLRLNKAASKRQWVVLAILAVLICAMKPLLFIFLPAIGLLIKRDKRTILVLIGITTLCVVALTSWFTLHSLNYADAQSPKLATGADAGRQVSNLIDHPLRAIRVAWNTYMTTYGDGQVRGLIGTFGSADTLLPLWVVMINVVVVSVALFFGKDSRDEKRSRIGRIGLLTIILLGVIYFVGINASMYIAYTPVNFDIFYGVQGRYFIPIVFIIALAAVGRSIQLNIKDASRLNTYIMAASIFCVLFSVATLVQRYYFYTP